jgi:hypothetical protein
MNKVITKRWESDKIWEDDIQERPLFFEFKYTPQFLNKYKKIFKKDFLQIIEESK